MEGEALLALPDGVVVKVAGADVGPGERGILPLADLLGRRVVHHDPGDLLRGDGAIGLRSLAFGDRGLVLLRLDARLQRRDRRLLLPDLAFARRVHRERRLEELGDVRVLEGPRVLQDAGQGVVVFRRDRIELVVMAAGAADRLGQEGLAERVELLVDDVHLELLLVLLLEVGVAEHEEGRRDQLAAPLLQVRRREEVPRDLLADETVVGPVVLERLDHVVAVAPGLLHDEAAEGERLAEAGDVEPVAAPALAEGAGGQQAIHDFFEGVRRWVVHELVDLLGARRHAEEIEGDAPQEDGLVGGRRGPQILGLEVRVFVPGESQV